jgi:hypothetical protein
MAEPEQPDKGGQVPPEGRARRRGSGWTWLMPILTGFIFVLALYFAAR